MDGLTTAPTGFSAHYSLFDSLAALTEPVRCRMLLLLESTELTVTELCAVLQLPQSTASRHLKTLGDDAWVRARPEGTRRLYSAGPALDEERTRALWTLLRTEIEGSAPAEEDRRRLDSVLSERQTESERFFSTAAGEWSQLRRELYGERFDLEALLALAPPDAVVGDLGTGTGEVARSLAPFVKKILAVDASDAMLQAAGETLSGIDNAEIRRGRLEALPIADGELDIAILGLVLHHLAEPDKVLAETGRALRTGGLLLVLEMQAHDREDYRQRMGHVWLGFDRDQLASWCAAAGLAPPQILPLPPDPVAKGPGLFVARTTKL